jgi:MinD superfamily P-loop ATPase
MKTILIYSGKGGVGKSTTTANLARSLSKKHRVYVLDADVNTPSLNKFFDTPNVNKNLIINSFGFESNNLIYIEGAMIRKYISKAINEINQFKPHFVLIDTPPSLSDVHINLIEKFKISGIILITQPTEVSKQDVNRTATFFINKNINIIGIVENMSVPESNIEYNWRLLTKVPFINSSNNNEIYKRCRKQYDEIVANLGNLENVLLENKIKQYTDESITLDDFKNDINNYANNFINVRYNNLKFINVQTWDYIADKLADMQDNGLIITDQFLTHCTADHIKRLLEAFQYDENAHFMVVRAPATEIDLIPGEIGECSLLVGENSYYGVPRVKYKTSKGEVVLFPYEVMPADKKEIDLCLQDGGTITKDRRYLPSKEAVRQCYYAFGSRIGLHDDWENRYDKILTA